MTSSWPTIEPPTEKRKALFVKKPISKMDFVWDRQDKAMNISKKTKHVKVIVVSRDVITPSFI